jgi:hypothetical protein
VTNNDEPILFANVHIGNGNQTARLVVFEGEDPEEVVATFCIKYGLNDDIARKLKELITS